MDEMKNLEEVLSAVKNIAEKLQAEKNILAEENIKLNEVNKEISAERDILLAENERLRKINENFLANMQQFSRQFQIVIRDEFQKFFAATIATKEEFSDNEKNLAVSDENEVEVLEAEEKLPVDIQNIKQKKKMLYADFYAEEAGFDKE